MGKLSKLKIKPDEESRLLQFRPNLHDQTQPVEFETSFEEAMAIMGALQHLQAKYRIPIPASLRPSGPPNLSIVEVEEDLGRSR